MGLLDMIFGGGDPQPQPQPAPPPGLLAPQYDGWARLGNALSQGAATHSLAGLLGGALDPTAQYRLQKAAQDAELNQYDVNYYRRNQPQDSPPPPAPYQAPLPALQGAPMPQMQPQPQPGAPATGTQPQAGPQPLPSLPPPFQNGAAPHATALPMAMPTAGGDNSFIMTPAMALMQAQRMMAAPKLAANAMAAQKFAETMMTNGTGVRGDGSIGVLPGADTAAGQMSGAKAGGEAPYKILEALAGQAGRAVQIEPGASVATGFQNMPPEVAAAFRRVLGGAGGTGSAPPQRMAGGPPPGSLPPLPAFDANRPPPGQMQPGTGPGTNAVGFPTQPGRENGRLQNPVTLEGATMQKTVLPAQFEKAGQNYQASQGVLGQLDEMDRNIEELNKANWSSTGAGANTKMAAFKGINGIVTTFGGDAVFDPKQIGNWEDFNKLSTRMGFEVAKTLGSREAMMIVQQAVGAVPGAENTLVGAKLVSSSLRQAATRQSDYYEFLTDFATSHGGSTWGADVAFNKAHPVSGYVKAAIANAQQGKQTVGPAESAPVTKKIGDKSYTWTPN